MQPLLRTENAPIFLNYALLYYSEHINDIFTLSLIHNKISIMLLLNMMHINEHPQLLLHWASLLVWFLSLSRSLFLVLQHKDEGRSNRTYNS